MRTRDCNGGFTSVIRGILNLKRIMTEVLLASIKLNSFNRM